METLQFELKTKGDSGSFEGIMSAPVLDRDDEIVDFGAFDPLPAHITIDIDHALTVEKTVGSGVPYYDTDGLLKVKGTFSSTPLGQLTRTLVKEGHIRHMSVAFRGAVRAVDEKTGIQHVVKGELINCTITGIPANTATALVAKVGARNAAKDLERLQATHDHMVELGAVCGEKHFIAIDGAPQAVTLSGLKFTNASPGITISNNGVVTADFTKSTDTETPASGAAQSAAPDAGAQVEVVRAQVALALAEAELVL